MFSTAIKMFEKISEKRIRQCLEHTLEEPQSRFRSGILGEKAQDKIIAFIDA